MGFDHFLLKGLRKVTGEFALMCLGYNMKRAKTLLGFEKMMELMAADDFEIRIVFDKKNMTPECMEAIYQTYNEVIQK